MGFRSKIHNRDRTILIEKFRHQSGIRDISYHHLTSPTFFLFLKVGTVSRISEFIQHHHFGGGTARKQMADVV